MAALDYAAGLYELLNAAGLLNIGLAPEWTDQDAWTGAPSAPDDGIALLRTPRALIGVDLREDPAFRTSRVVITAADAATTYTVTINGTAVNVTGHATVSAVAAALDVAIAGNPTVDALVTAVVDPDDATSATLLITGKADADYSINATVSGGTGTLTFNADAVTCDVRVWLAYGGTVASGSTGRAGSWVCRTGQAESSVDYGGTSKALDVAGYDRIYVEVDGVAGHGSDGGAITLNIASVMVGRSILPSSS